MRKYKYLNKKNAIKITIQLWTWLKETGSEYKDEWPGWGKIKKEYGKNFLSACPLCEYGEQINRAFDRCTYCPYSKQYRRCWKEPSLYVKWRRATRKRDRQRYAGQFLEQLKTLK